MMISHITPQSVSIVVIYDALLTRESHFPFKEICFLLFVMRDPDISKIDFFFQDTIGW